MNPKIASAMKSAISKIDTGRFKSGRNEMLAILRDCEDSQEKIFTAYNLGSIFWAHIGNGEKAREFYQMLVEEAERFGVEKVEQVFPSMVANACENLMHLSLTFEEFFAWADKLRKIQPDDDIFRGMVPFIEEDQESGIPWANELEKLAQACYNRQNPKLDRGEYARAVSTYHLILANRKAMHLSREAWSRVTYEYGALALRVASDALKIMERTEQSPNTTEISFMVLDAKPFVDEYFAANPSSAEVRFLIDHMEKFLRQIDDVKNTDVVAALNHEGLDFLNRREFRAALAKFTEAERICRETGDQEKLQVCLGNLVLVAANTGDPQRALELVTEKEKICRNLKLFSSLANALTMKASILDSINKTKEAIKITEEANRLCNEHGLDEIRQNVQILLRRFHSK